MKYPLLVNSFQDRNNFGQFLVNMGFGPNETAVEVGTDKGVFARMLLQFWPGKLVCVDPYYRAYDAEEIPEMSGNRFQDYKEAVLALREYGKRAQIIRLSSVDASALFARESLCFVYVDACHQYEAVKQDIEVWWPKLKKGGVLAGHDIVSSGEDHKKGWGRHVQPAVFDFAVQHELIVHLVTGPKTLPWSYYMIKPTD